MFCICLWDIVWRPWKSFLHLPMGHNMSLAKCFACLLDIIWRPWKSVLHLSMGHRIVWRPWQSVLHVSIGHHMTSLAKCFACVYWTSYHMTSLEKCFTCVCGTWYGVIGKCFAIVSGTSYHVIGKVFCICLWDIIWRHWQSVLHLPMGHHVTSLTKCFVNIWGTSCNILLELWRLSVVSRGATVFGWAFLVYIPAVSSGLHSDTAQLLGN